MARSAPPFRLAACTLWGPACRDAGRGGQWTALAVGMAVALAASPGQAVPAMPAGGFGMPTPVSPVNEAIVGGDLDAAERLSGSRRPLRRPARARRRRGRVSGRAGDFRGRARAPRGPPGRRQHDRARRRPRPEERSRHERPPPPRAPAAGPPSPDVSPQPRTLEPRWSRRHSGMRRAAWGSRMPLRKRSAPRGPAQGRGGTRRRHSLRAHQVRTSPTAGAVRHRARGRRRRSAAPARRRDGRSDHPHPARPSPRPSRG